MVVESCKSKTHPQITPILSWLGIIPDMPIYEYECRKCKAHIEVFQKVSDKPPTKCRKCGGKLERKISAPAIQFKGSGWYVTDYAGKKQDTAEEKKSAAAEPTATTGDKTIEKTTQKEKIAAKTSDTTKTT